MSEVQRLLNIARGCKDYGGGYRHDKEKFEIYHHGVQTVINALESAVKKDDPQLRVLENVGKESVKGGR
jgi:hypothetical protein